MQARVLKCDNWLWQIHSVVLTSATLATTMVLILSSRYLLRISILLNEHLQGVILQVLLPWTLAMKTAKKVIITGVMAAMISCRGKLMTISLVYEHACMHRDVLGKLVTMTE